uniref:F-box/kelch-repeat protein At3g06240 family n=2 Tax=Cajanus cajan TaxID=3821 RepID=A0A151TSD1_CAJCA|nr:F-box/kelch-repeat protein At3g06240 family [Cajanus cajan]
MKNTTVLPWEMIIEILLRLPVKSLVRFKCVCKSWFVLLSDPRFATSHFELASARTHTLILIAPSASQIRFIDFNAPLHHDFASAVINLSFLPPNTCYKLQIVGSCRGFLLLNCCQSLWVWNPSTRVHKKVSPSPIEFTMNAICFTLSYGFWYDPSKDDYLVVKASHKPNSRYNATCVQFFSLRDNAWGDIEASHLSYLDSFESTKGGSILNGAIHWLGFRHGMSMFAVVAFDLTKRSFSEIPLSDDFQGHFECCDLGKLRELLSLYCIVGWNQSVEIWVMNEYKVQSSWTKAIVVSINDIPTGCFSLICSTKDGDMVGTNGRCRLAKYNDKGQLLEHRSYCNGPCRSQVSVYTESLFSLP